MQYRKYTLIKNRLNNYLETICKIDSNLKVEENQQFFHYIFLKSYNAIYSKYLINH